MRFVQFLFFKHTLEPETAQEMKYFFTRPF